MVGIGESYLALYVLAAGYSEVAAGLVSTVPFLLGALLQLCAPYGVQWFGTLKRWVVFAASLQAASLVPLAIMAAAGRSSLWAIFIVATLYWAASMGCGAGWTTWIGMLVPSRIRARYFSFKSRFSHAATLAGLVAGGLILQFGADHREAVLPFAALFLIAAAARGGCAYYLWKQSETGPVPDNHRVVGPGELWRRFRSGPDGQFLLYMMLVQVAVQMAQPFFAPYMRVQLHMDYGQILVLTGAAFITKSAMQPIWGAFAHRHGARGLLWIGGLGIVPLSALWLVSDSFWYLLAMQLVAGAMWAAYELAVLLMMFEAIHEHERTSLWATFNVMNAFAMVLGSLIGGAILADVPGAAGYQAIFLISLAARLATVLYLRRAREPGRRPDQLLVEIEAVRPSVGTIDRPLIADLPADDAPPATPADAAESRT